MAVAAAAMVLTVFVGPVHAQTGYGDDTVPPRSLTAGGNLPTAKGTNASHKSSNSAGVIIGVILAIIVIGGVLWFVLGRRNDGSATT
ncbi:MAG: hypothetical protein QOG03_1742 [Actinomycetota bacterium]|jgi:hypothetical protein|nr:hypothetical protein [Actinomycetota bacterium]